jgi:N-acetylmuramoyl-L-alanine amidase
VFKFAAIISSVAICFLAGCSTAPTTGNESLPKVWEETNAVPHRIIAQVQNPAKPVKPTSPVVRPLPARPAPVPTWTSLDRWAAECKLPAPKRLSELPVASYSIASPKGAMVLEIGSREAMWNGSEINLGFAPEIIDDQVFVYGLDLQKNLEPLLLGEPLAFGGTRVLVLDPGHGGKEAGARSVLGERSEKEFALDWARRLKPLLETNGWTVFLTRTNDSDIALSNRVNFAEAHHADVFVSLHFNSAAPDTKQGGLEIYCLTPTGMPSTLTRGYTDTWSDHYPNNSFDAENMLLAVRLYASLQRATGEEDRGVRRARFMGVLRGQKRPAVLIEGGFLSNPAEAKKIETPEFRQKLAEGIAEALK